MKIVRLLLSLTGIGVFIWAHRRFLEEKRLALAELRRSAKTIETKLGTVEYAEQGQGEVVLIIHGGGGGYEHGIALADLLQLQNKRVIAISRPGHRQTPLGTNRSPEEQAAVVKALLDALKIDSATVLAHSAGGLTALAFAIQHPEKCRRLIMLSAHTPILRHHAPAPYWFWLLDLMMASDFLLWLLTKLAFKALNDVETNPEKQAGFRKFFAGAFPASDWRTGMMNDLHQVRTIEGMDLSAIDAPTLILHGTNDVQVPYPVAVYLAEQLADNDFISIEGGTHFMMVSHQAELALLVNNFLED